MMKTFVQIDGQNGRRHVYNQTERRISILREKQAGPPIAQCV